MSKCSHIKVNKLAPAVSWLNSNQRFPEFVVFWFWIAIKNLTMKQEPHKQVRSTCFVLIYFGSGRLLALIELTLSRSKS